MCLMCFRTHTHTSIEMLSLVLIILLSLLLYLENSHKKPFLVEIIFLLRRVRQQNVIPPVVNSRLYTINSFA